jgi:hypothetical protein
MELYKNPLKPILEDDTSSENNDDMNNKCCIELTFYPDTMPSIKSYYIMTNLEYEDLKTLHMDLYIENFLNDEDLTKEKLDIYVVNNSNNIITIKNFINQFGNPFDIINFINAKNYKQKQLNKLKQQEKTVAENLIDNFSESESETDSTSDSSSCHIDGIYPNQTKKAEKISEQISEPIIKPNIKPNTKLKTVKSALLHNNEYPITSKSKVSAKSTKN